MDWPALIDTRTTPRDDAWAFLRDLARTHVWWTPPDLTLAEPPRRLIARVMARGSWEEAMGLLALTGPEPFIDVLRNPPPGELDDRDWAFWHLRLGVPRTGRAPRGRRIPGD
jgi:hypothetical protein